MDERKAKAGKMYSLLKKTFTGVKGKSIEVQDTLSMAITVCTDVNENEMVSTRERSTTDNRAQM